MILNETHITIWNLLKIHPRGLCVKEFKITMKDTLQEDIKHAADQMVAAGKLTFSTYNDRYKIAKTAKEPTGKVEAKTNKKKAMSKTEASRVKQTIILLASNHNGVRFTDILQHIAQEVPCQQNAHQFLRRLLEKKALIKHPDPSDRRRCIYYAAGFEPAA